MTTGEMAHIQIQAGNEDFQRAKDLFMKIRDESKYNSHNSMHACMHSCCSFQYPPQDTVNLLLNDITSLSNIIMARVQGQGIAKLQTKEVDEGTIQDVRDISANSEVALPFQDVDTEYRQSTPNRTLDWWQVS